MNPTNHPPKAPRAVGKATARRRMLSRAAGFLLLARDVLDAAHELEPAPSLEAPRASVAAALRALVTRRPKKE